MKKLLPAVLVFITMASCFCGPGDQDKFTYQDSFVDSALTANDIVDTFSIKTGDSTETFYDCSVLSRKIPGESQQAAIRSDLGKLIHCGIDSFDFLYVVPNLFPGFVSENHVSGKKVTYGDFVTHVNEFKNTDSYYQLHVRVNTLDSLRTVKFDVNKLYTMKPTLGKLGFTEPEWEMFSGFARTYPVPKKGFYTWGDLLDAFDTYKPKEM